MFLPHQPRYCPACLRTRAFLRVTGGMLCEVCNYRLEERFTLNATASRTRVDFDSTVRRAPQSHEYRSHARP